MAKRQAKTLKAARRLGDRIKALVWTLREIRKAQRQHPDWTKADVEAAVLDKGRREFGDGKLLALIFEFLKWLLPLLMAI